MPVTTSYRKRPGDPGYEEDPYSLSQEELGPRYAEEEYAPPPPKPRIAEPPVRSIEPEAPISPEPQPAPVPPGVSSMPARSSDAIERARKLAANPPKPPQSGLLKTIGTGLLSRAWGPEAANTVMHPRYASERQRYDQQMADATEAAKLDITQRNSETLEAQRDAAAATHKATIDENKRKQAEVERANTARESLREEELQDKTFTAVAGGRKPVFHDENEPPYPGYIKLPAVPSRIKSGLAAYVPAAGKVTKELVEAGVVPGMMEGDVMPPEVEERALKAYYNIIEAKAKLEAKPDIENEDHWRAVVENPKSTPEEISVASRKLKGKQKDAIAQITAGTEARMNVADKPIPTIENGSHEFTVAQDLAYGKLTFQQFGRLYSYSRDVRKKLAIYDKAGELNPAFNPAAFEMGYRLAVNPKVQQQLASMDNVKQAVPDLLAASDAASRSGITVLNKLINPAGYALGNKHYSNLALARTAFADELSGALGFGSATDMSREMGFNMTDSNLSPEAFRDGIQNIVIPFINRKRDTLLHQMGPYGESGMNPAAPPPPPKTDRPPLGTYER